jgi:hypothetical protein
MPQTPLYRRPLVVAILMIIALVVAGCAGGSGSDPGSSDSPGATQDPITTPEQAVAAVIAAEPRLTGIGPLDPDLIGQSSWVEVAPASGVGAFLVNVRVGWGDCPAGCISEHTWVYAVAPDGTVTLQSEGGEPVPDDAWPSPGGEGRTGLMITATAGPACPVESIPPRPECAPRPVPGAVVVIRDPAGTELQTVTLDGHGTAFVDVASGGYAIEASPVDGLLGSPPEVNATVIDGVGTPVELAYDTGIR